MKERWDDCSHLLTELWTTVDGDRSGVHRTHDSVDGNDTPRRRPPLSTDERPHVHREVHTPKTVRRAARVLIHTTHNADDDDDCSRKTTCDTVDREGDRGVSGGSRSVRAKARDERDPVRGWTVAGATKR